MSSHGKERYQATVGAEELVMSIVFWLTAVRLFSTHEQKQNSLAQSVRCGVMVVFPFPGTGVWKSDLLNDG